MYMNEKFLNFAFEDEVNVEQENGDIVLKKQFRCPYRYGQKSCTCND